MYKYLGAVYCAVESTLQHSWFDPFKVSVEGLPGLITDCPRYDQDSAGKSVINKNNEKLQF